MPSVEEIVDRLSGMITKEQAAALSGRTSNAMSVDGLIELMDKRKAEDTHAAAADPFTVNVKDSVYRIFNPVSLQTGSVHAVKRCVVLGKEGSTLRLSLRGRLSEFIDTGAFERDDVIEVDNAVFDIGNGELVDGMNTVMSKVSHARHDAIADYSALGNGLRNIDVIGKMIEIGPLRYADVSGKRLAASDCVLTDLKRSVDASLWGSSALATARIRVNDFVKMEFCSTRAGRDGLMLHAGDLSRIVANRDFGRRLSAK
jgi:hypothetical protein